MVPTPHKAVLGIKQENAHKVFGAQEISTIMSYLSASFAAIRKVCNL